MLLLLSLLSSSLDKGVAVAKLVMAMMEDMANAVIPWTRPWPLSWPRWLWPWSSTWPTRHQRELAVAMVGDQADTMQHRAGNT